MKQIIAERYNIAGTDYSPIKGKNDFAHPSPGRKKGRFFGLAGHFYPVRESSRIKISRSFGTVDLCIFSDNEGIIYMQEFSKPGTWKEIDDPEELLKVPKGIKVELYLVPTNKETFNMIEEAVRIGSKYAVTKKEYFKKVKEDNKKHPRHKCNQCGNYYNNADERQSKVLCPECRESL